MTVGAADPVETAGAHFELIGRAGWVAKGVLYALLGVLLVRVAVGGPRADEANQTGAVEEMATSTAGTALLVAVATGLALYVLWRVFTAVLPGDWTGRALLDRIGYVVSALVYATLLVTTVGILRERRTRADEREDRMVEALVKELLGVTAGRVMVVLAGIAVVGLGMAFAHKGWSRGFRDEITGDTGVESRAIDRLGVIGWTARGLSMGLIGLFLARAAWTYDPDEAAGLDDSIRQVAGTPLGTALAVAVGLGFTAYGAFAVLSARHRHLRGPRNQPAAGHDADAVRDHRFGTSPLAG